MEENNTTQPLNEEKKGMSIASMVLGLVGLIVAAIPCGILAIIFSVLGRKKGGKGFAIAGLVLGIIDVVFGMLSVLTIMSIL